MQPNNLKPHLCHILLLQVLTLPIDCAKVRLQLQKDGSKYK